MQNHLGLFKHLTAAYPTVVDLAQVREEHQHNAVFFCYAAIDSYIGT